MCHQQALHETACHQIGETRWHGKPARTFVAAATKGCSGRRRLTEQTPGGWCPERRGSGWSRRRSEAPWRPKAASRRRLRSCPKPRWLAEASSDSSRRLHGLAEAPRLGQSGGRLAKGPSSRGGRGLTEAAHGHQGLTRGSKACRGGADST